MLRFQRRSSTQACIVRAAQQQSSTSIELAKVRLTMAAMMATPPSLQGSKKCTASKEAVTTGPFATVLAARPAQMSIQLSTYLNSKYVRTRHDPAACMLLLPFIRNADEGEQYACVASAVAYAGLLAYAHAWKFRMCQRLALRSACMHVYIWRSR